MADMICGNLLLKNFSGGRNFLILLVRFCYVWSKFRRPLFDTYCSLRNDPLRVKPFLFSGSVGFAGCIFNMFMAGGGVSFLFRVICIWVNLPRRLLFTLITGGRNLVGIMRRARDIWRSSRGGTSCCPNSLESPSLCGKFTRRILLWRHQRCVLTHADNLWNVRHFTSRLQSACSLSSSAAVLPIIRLSRNFRPDVSEPNPFRVKTRLNIQRIHHRFRKFRTTFAELASFRRDFRRELSHAASFFRNFRSGLSYGVSFFRNFRRELSYAASFFRNFRRELSYGVSFFRNFRRGLSLIKEWRRIFLCRESGRNSQSRNFRRHISHAAGFFRNFRPRISYIAAWLRMFRYDAFCVDVSVFWLRCRAACFSFDFWDSRCLKKYINKTEILFSSVISLWEPYSGSSIFNALTGSYWRRDSVRATSYLAHINLLSSAAIFTERIHYENR